MSKIFNSNETFEGIFKQYFNPLVNFVNSHINNWEDSREIVQNSFMKIWRSKDKVEINTSVKAYLYQTTRNGMIDFIRSSKKDATIKETLLHQSQNFREEERLDSMIIRDEINKALARLKPKNKRIFELSKMEGLTHKEIAAHLNISVRSVEDNINRATNLLKEMLEETSNIYG